MVFKISISVRHRKTAAAVQVLLQRVNQRNRQILCGDIAGLAIGLHQRFVLARTVLAGTAL